MIKLEYRRAISLWVCQKIGFLSSFLRPEITVGVLTLGHSYNRFHPVALSYVPFPSPRVILSPFCTCLAPGQQEAGLRSLWSGASAGFVHLRILLAGSAVEELLSRTLEPLRPVCSF